MARREWNPPQRIYAAYRGDAYIGEGTIAEIAAMAGVSYATAKWGEESHRTKARCDAEGNPIEGHIDLGACRHGRRRSVRHGGQRSRRHMRRERERVLQKRLIALGREVERRKQNGKHEDLADKDDA